MKVKPLENYQLLGTTCTVDRDTVYDASWATNQPDWQRDRKIFIDEPVGLLLKIGEYVIVESDPPPDIFAIKNLLHEWSTSVDIPRESADNESGFICLTDDRMLQILERTRKMLPTLVEP